MPTVRLVLVLLGPMSLVAFVPSRASEEAAPPRVPGGDAGTVLREYDAGAAFASPRFVRHLVVPQGNLILPHRPLVAGDLVVDPGFGSGPEGDRSPAPAGVSQEALSIRDWLLGSIRDFLHGEALLSNPDEQVRLEGTALSIRASAEEHERIAERLEPLTAASEPVGIDAVLAPAEVLDAAFPGWRASGPEGLPVEALEKALADPQSRSFRLEARSGELVASGGRTIGLFHAGSEVNQTGVLPVSNPVLVTPMAGARLEVLPVLLPGGGRVWLDVRMGSFHPEAEPRVAGDEWGRFDFPRVDETLVATRLMAERGKAIVAAVMEEGAPCALVLRVAAPRTVAARRGSPAGRIAVHHLAPLLSQGGNFPWPFAPEKAEAGEGMRPPESEGIRSRLLAALGEGFEDRAGDGKRICSALSDRMVVAGPPDAHATVEAILGREAGERSRMVAIEVVAVEAPAPALTRIRGLTEGGPGGGGVLPVGWETVVEALKDVRLHRFAVRGCHRAVHAVRQARVRRFLTEYSRVSGGTGYSTVECIQPETSSCADGAEMRLRADLDGDPARPGRTARLQVDGAIAAILDERELKVPYRLHGGSGSDGSPSGAEPPRGSRSEREGTARLSLPRQKFTRWDLERRVPLGRHVVLQTESGEYGAVVLIGRVSAE